MPHASPAPPLLRVIAQDRHRHLQVQIRGEGEPTVVLLTGLGTPAGWWHDLDDGLDDILTLIARDAWEEAPFLAPELARHFRVVTYDRAGMQDSTAPEQPRTLDDFLLELDAVLQAVNVNQPVLLIGHSIGGLIALEYTRRSPHRVQALVLLDSSHPDQLARFAVTASAEQLQLEAEDRRQFREHHPERPDLDALLGRGATAIQAGCLGELPLLVVSRGIKPGHETNAPSLESMDLYLQHREQIWQALQTELVACSKQGRQLRLSSPYHYVYLDQPRAILQVINAFLEDIRT
jgi:pimeloyl-ACP methyl ester carboxylesterase